MPNFLESTGYEKPNCIGIRSSTSRSSDVCSPLRCAGGREAGGVADSHLRTKFGFKQFEFTMWKQRQLHLHVCLCPLHGDGESILHDHIVRVL